MLPKIFDGIGILIGERTFLPVEIRFWRAYAAVPHTGKMNLQVCKMAVHIGVAIKQVRNMAVRISEVIKHKSKTFARIGAAIKHVR